MLLWTWHNIIQDIHRPPPPSSMYALPSSPPLLLLLHFPLILTSLTQTGNRYDDSYYWGGTFYPRYYSSMYGWRAYYHPTCYRMHLQCLFLISSFFLVDQCVLFANVLFISSSCSSGPYVPTRVYRPAPVTHVSSPLSSGHASSHPSYQHTGVSSHTGYHPSSSIHSYLFLLLHLLLLCSCIHYTLVSFLFVCLIRFFFSFLSSLPLSYFFPPSSGFGSSHSGFSFSS